MIAWILVTPLLIVPFPASAETEPAPAATAAPRSAPDQAAFDRILRAHVKGGRVNYSAIKSRDGEALEAYLGAVATANLKGLKRGEKLAFYLNAYNALVIKSVLDRLPLRSVKTARGFFDGTSHKVAGRSVTLNDLENKIIRPLFKEPRVHFALVCAARSCPPLMARAFKAKTLNRDLDRLTRAFLGSPSGLVIGGGRGQGLQAVHLVRRGLHQGVRFRGRIPGQVPARGCRTAGHKRAEDRLPGVRLGPQRAMSSRTSLTLLATAGSSSKVAPSPALFTTIVCPLGG